MTKSNCIDIFQYIKRFVRNQENSLNERVLSYQKSTVYTYIYMSIQTLKKNKTKHKINAFIWLFVIKKGVQWKNFGNKIQQIKEAIYLDSDGNEQGRNRNVDNSNTKQGGLLILDFSPPHRKTHIHMYIRLIIAQLKEFAFWRQTKDTTLNTLAIFRVKELIKIIRKMFMLIFKALINNLIYRR